MTIDVRTIEDSSSFLATFTCMFSKFWIMRQFYKCRSISANDRLDWQIDDPLRWKIQWRIHWLQRSGQRVMLLMYENIRKEALIYVHLVYLDIGVMCFNVYKQRDVRD